jgi:UDP-N-acetylglucosamine 2-epimerase (non-hydrolysing)
MNQQIGVLYGTRPEIIKLAPVIHALRDEGHVDVVEVFTGQHEGAMSDSFLELFGLEPRVNLGLLSPGQDIADLLSRAIAGGKRCVQQFGLSGLVVQGDTTSALAGSLAATFESIPAYHVEAGLRSGDNRNPFPEEYNRRLIGQVASLHFPPTERGRLALLRENCDANSIVVTGNTVVDSLSSIVSMHPEPKTVGRPYVVVTAHRRETVGAGDAGIPSAVGVLARRNPEFDFHVVSHANPAIALMWAREFGNFANVDIRPPADYVSFVQLLRGSALVLTDSGGVQEEAASLGIRCVVMRTTTERPEGIESGHLFLAGTQTDEIVGVASTVLAEPPPLVGQSPYGDGAAGVRIAGAISQFAEKGALSDDDIRALSWNP